MRQPFLTKALDSCLHPEQTMPAFEICQHIHTLLC